MKFSKKTATIYTFILGFTILTVSAFADTMLGSGYYSLKDSIKTTTSKLTGDVDNFSANIFVAAKIDGEVFSETNNNVKYDITSKAYESSDKISKKGELKEFYFYHDENQRIYRNFNDNSYNVLEKRKHNNDSRKIIENPFENEQAKDAERILDAFVGSLQDIIQVEESGGKKMYTGNLSETQIPPLVNALSSFLFKYNILDERSADRLDVPSPKSNIHLINASGKAIENEEGIIESGIFTASISAQDSNGTEHIYSLDFSIEIKDINNTLVKAPNLDGQKVTYNKEGFEFDSKYIGKYKNDIVKTEENSFTKVGERFLEITSVEDGNLKGKYYEVYNESNDADNARSFDFYSNYDESVSWIIIHYTNENGENNTGIIHRTGIQNISLSLNVTIEEDKNGYSSSNNEDGFDNTFIKIFD
jgi:hypothetical protein